MAQKQTYQKSIVWKPDDRSETTKQLSSSGREVSYLKLSSGAGPASMSIYDAKSAGDANPGNLVWFLDCSTTDDDINPFPNPIGFKNGIYAVLEQGANLGAVLCLGYIPDQV